MSSYMSSNAGEEGGGLLRGLSQWVQLCQNKLRRSYFYFAKPEFFFYLDKLQSEKDNLHQQQRNAGSGAASLTGGAANNKVVMVLL
jgi:hypothetical protein